VKKLWASQGQGVNIMANMGKPRRDKITAQWPNNSVYNNCFNHIVNKLQIGLVVEFPLLPKLRVGCNCLNLNLFIETIGRRLAACADKIAAGCSSYSDYICDISKHSLGNFQEG
jgi:hypothetical protein